MALRDEIRKERQAFLENATKKEKINYFLEYYRLHITVTLIVVAVIIYLIVHALTDPEIILNGLFINLHEADQTVTVDDLSREFLEEQEIDSSKYNVSFGSGISLIEGDDAANYQSSQAMMIQSAAGTLDFIVGSRNILLDYAYGEVFVDLSTVLSKEDLAFYKPYLHYVDGEVVKQMRMAEEDLENKDHITIPDSTKPEEMADPIPVFIDMTGSKKLTSTYGPYAKDLIFGISVNAPNPENAVAFFKFLLK